MGRAGRVGRVDGEGEDVRYRESGGRNVCATSGFCSLLFSPTSFFLSFFFNEGIDIQRCQLSSDATTSSYRAYYVVW